MPADAYVMGMIVSWEEHGHAQFRLIIAGQAAAVVRQGLLAAYKQYSMFAILHPTAVIIWEHVLLNR